jgi:hypothetical protein
MNTLVELKLTDKEVALSLFKSQMIIYDLPEKGIEAFIVGDRDIRMRET